MDLNSILSFISAGRNRNQSREFSSGMGSVAGTGQYANNQHLSRRSSSSPDIFTNTVTDAVVEAVAHVFLDVAADVVASAGVNNGGT